MKKLLTAVFTVMFLAGMANAMPVIEVGLNGIAPNGFGVIDIYVSGDDPVQGVNLNLQIADGGTQLGGTIDGPSFFSVSIVSDSIFAGNNTGQIDSLDSCNPADADCLSNGTPANPIPHDQMWVAQTTTASGFVVAGDGSGGKAKLATIFIDASAYANGSWDFLLTGTLNGDTDFAGVPINITDGKLCIDSIAGDINCDGFVGLLDLDIIGKNWGMTPALWVDGDISGDNLVGLLDLDSLGLNWGNSVVPEPASLGLLAIGGLAMIRRR